MSAIRRFSSILAVCDSHRKTVSSEFESQQETLKMPLLENCFFCIPLHKGAFLAGVLQLIWSLVALGVSVSTLLDLDSTQEEGGEGSYLTRNSYWITRFIAIAILQLISLVVLIYGALSVSCLSLSPLNVNQGLHIQ